MKTKHKTLIVRDGDRKRSVFFQISRYANNNNLYVGVFECGDEPELLFDATVNLDERCEPNCSFVDVNNCPGIDMWLMHHGIAEPTMRWEGSGFCVYPEFRFDMDKLYEYGEDF